MTKSLKNIQYTTQSVSYAIKNTLLYLFSIKILSYNILNFNIYVEKYELNKLLINLKQKKLFIFVQKMNEYTLIGGSAIRFYGCRRYPMGVV